VQVYNKCNNNISSNSTTEKIQAFFPSDGVVLEKSQKAYPGVKIDDTYHMKHNNHMQVRNSSETKRALEDLYDGVLYDTFFKLR